MEKISINLLPIELRDQSKKHTKQSLLTKISVGILVTVIIITVAVLSWSVVLGSSLQKAENDLTSISQKVESQKDKESLATLLKGRIDVIKKIVDKDSPQTQSFNLITSLVPADLKMISFTVDKSGNVKMAAFTSSLPSMQDFFDSLTDPKKNEGKIGKVKVESLNKTIEGDYNLELSLSYALK